MAKKMALAVVGAAPPEPPRKLGPTGGDLWRTVQAEYAIRDCGGVETLMQVCAAVDRLEAIAERISRDGEVIETARGPKAHPLLRDEIQIRAFIVRSLTRLGLNVQEIKPLGRPGYALGVTG
jgi:hypothetical protein